MVELSLSAERVVVVNRFEKGSRRLRMWLVPFLATCSWLWTITPSLAVNNWPDTSTQPAATVGYPSVGRVLSDQDNVYGNTSSNIGTGFVIAVDGPLTGRLVVTAGHVVTNELNPALTNPFTWFQSDPPFMARGTPYPDGAPAGLAIRNPGFQKSPTGQDVNDVALVLMEAPVAGAVGLQLAAHQPSPNTLVTFLGNAGGNQGRETRLGLGRFDRVSGPNVLYNNAETQVPNGEGGDSGGPLLGFAPSDPGLDNRVVGVLSTLDGGNPGGFTATAVDATSPLLNAFVRGDIIKVPTSTEFTDANVDDRLRNNDVRGTFQSEKVVFFNATRQDFVPSRLLAGGLPTLTGLQGFTPSSALGLLNVGKLDIVFGKNITQPAVGEEGGYQGEPLPPDTRMVSNELLRSGAEFSSPEVAVLKIGESGTLNARGAQLRVIGGILETASLHNRGDMYLAPARGRRLDIAPDFGMWSAGLVVTGGSILNESHLIADADQIKAKVLGNPVEPAGGLAAAALEAIGGDFIQSDTGVLDIVWDNVFHQDHAPVSVEGDIFLAGSVNVFLPEDLDIANEVKLRLFEFGGTAEFDSAHLLFHQGSREIPFALHAENGVLLASAIPEPSTAILLLGGTITFMYARFYQRRRVVNALAVADRLKPGN